MKTRHNNSNKSKCSVALNVANFLFLLTAKAWADLSVEIESDTESSLFLESPTLDTDFGEVNANVDIRYFTLTQPSSAISVRASYGPLTVRQTLYPSADPTSLRRNDSLSTATTGGHRSQPQIAATGEISAHLVTREVRPSSPVLRVLFYAGHASGDYTQRARDGQPVCATVEAHFQADRLSAACSPSASREGACLAEIIVPIAYWQSDSNTQKQSKANIIKVYYSIDHRDHCGDESSPAAARTERNADQFVGPLTHLADVPLTPFQGNYEEVTGDSVVTVLVPQLPVYPNSKLYVPVRYAYSPDYPFTGFALRVRVKTGVRILGAQLCQPGKQWQISVDISPKLTAATVTAYLRDYDLQQDSQSEADQPLESAANDVFAWLFEIDDGVDIGDSGRIVWQLIYTGDGQTGGAAKLDFDKESVKLTSRLDIQKDDVLDVLAITKSRQLLNTAGLTGRQVSRPMRVYVVSSSGRVSDVTLQSSCHAADESILKVSPSCTSVYLDGSEVRGSQNASVLIKYGTHTGVGSFMVWTPKLPLDVRPDDIKLSQIKSWKTAQLKRKHQHSTQTGDELSTEDGGGGGQSNSRPTDQANDSTDRSNYSPGCRLRYQQTRVEVYARFYSSDHNSGREASLLGRRLALRVTDLVIPFMRVSDASVLSLRGHTVAGLDTGRAELQVISPISGRLIGSREIRVAADKETLTHLDVRIVAGLELEVRPHESLSNVWQAKTTLMDKLVAQYQEGLLDIRLHFSDGTFAPLADIAPTDYSLSVDTFDGSVAFAPSGGLNPRIIAVSPGRGQLLHVSLELSGQCQRRRTQPIAMKYVNINVEFPAANLQNDAHNYRKNLSKTAGQPSDTNGVPREANSGYKAAKPRGEIATNDGAGSSGSDDAPKVEARQNASFAARANMSTLEVGIYSVLAVFGVAVAILVVTCSVFAVRLRYKNPPETITTTRIAPITSNRPVVANANEWVWLGKATLDRNSGVRPKWPQTLIPNIDFNGNLSANCGPETNNVRRLDSGQKQAIASADRSSGLSEISIRITTNPNPLVHDDADEPNANRRPSPAPRAAPKMNSLTEPPQPPDRKASNWRPKRFSTYTKRPPIPPHRNLNEIRPLVSRSAAPPVPPHQNQSRIVKSDGRDSDGHRVRLQISAPLRVELPMSKSDIDYKQLMEYFENLRESNA